MAEPKEAEPEVTGNVEKVLAHRIKKGCLEFQIQWKGFENVDAPENRVWQPIKNFRTNYDRKSKLYLTWDKMVFEYMTEQKLPFNKKGC